MGLYLTRDVGIEGASAFMLVELVRRVGRSELSLKSLCALAFRCAESSLIPGMRHRLTVVTD